MSTVEYVYNRKVAAIHKLRINVKSLAAEARFIRREEKRCGPEYRFELQHHRRDRVRGEARHAQLALAFVRGMKYSRVERGANVAPELGRLIKKIGQYVTVSESEVVKWLKT